MCEWRSAELEATGLPGECDHWGLPAIGVSAESLAIRLDYRINNASYQPNNSLGLKTMKRFLALVGDLIFHASRSRFERELAGRPQPDDRAFYEAHYGGSGIPEDIPVRIRKVSVKQLGACWMGLRPDDECLRV